VLSASALGNTRFFLGRPYDAELGIYDLRARWYDPRLGVFLSPDPLGPVDSWNAFQYGFATAGTWFDPFGWQSNDTQWWNYTCFQCHAREDYPYVLSFDQTMGGRMKAEADSVAMGAIGTGTNSLLWVPLLNTDFVSPRLRPAVEEYKGIGVAWSSIITSLLGVAAIGMDGEALGAGITRFAEGEELVESCPLSEANQAARGGKGLTTPGKFFGDKTAKEASEALGKKFGPPRSSRPGADTFYNPKSGRSYNVHTDPAHGPSHVDIRTRGPVPDRRVPLGGGN